MALIDIVDELIETLNESRSKEWEIMELANFTKRGIMSGDGIIDDIPLTQAQLNSIAASYAVKKADLITILSNLP